MLSSLPEGSTFVETSPVPHGQPVPADAAPLRRCEHRGHRGRRGELVGLEDGRVGHERAAVVVGAGHALPAKLHLSGPLERVVPDHVARQQALHLRGEQRRGLADALLGGRGRERVREPRKAAHAVLERLDDRLVLVAQRPGRRDRLGAVDVELLLAREPGDLLLELRALHAGGEQVLAELAPDLLRRRRDLRDLRHVALVGAGLAARLAALDPEDEQDDDQDREGDQADQAQQRRQVLRRARWARRAARTLPADDPFRPARLLRGRFLLEEVEIDVGVVLGHGCLQEKAGSLYRLARPDRFRRRITGGKAKTERSCPRRPLRSPPASS